MDKTEAPKRGRGRPRESLKPLVFTMRMRPDVMAAIEKAVAGRETKTAFIDRAINRELARMRKDG